LPARYEPFGLSILEAARAGCALVLGDIPSLRENWTDAAVFVPPDDHDALAAAITRLIETPAERTRLGWRAGVRARRFTARRMADAYVAAYGGLLS
ncbi:MAG: glycosyltransferase, partial [Vicinamibacterales bacterium]